MDKFYQARVDRVIDYIQTHIVDSLTVAELAELACFSEYHFNRVFKARTGENLYRFVRRLRLERAARMLLCEELSITEVALNSGFSNSASFAKSFKQLFGVNATEWKMAHGRLQKQQGINAAECCLSSSNDQVRIEVLSPLKIAYVRNIGSYISNAALFNHLYRQLFNWAAPRDVPLSPTYNLYHDSPFITQHSNLRVMVALEVPNNIVPTGDIGSSQLNGGRYAIRRYFLKEDEFSGAWNWMTDVWIPDSGFLLDTERESIERCFGETQHYGSTLYQVDICIPVKPAP